MTTPPVPQWAVDAKDAKILLTCDGAGKAAKAEALARIIAAHAPKETEDGARLDWLEQETRGGDVSLGHYPFAAPNKDKKWALVRGYCENYENTIRAAIDAARKKDL
jgi:hypothetical protein